MTRSVPTRLCAVAILVAIAGMVIQIATGVKYGTVPHGKIRDESGRLFRCQRTQGGHQAFMNGQLPPEQ